MIKQILAEKNLQVAESYVVKPEKAEDYGMGMPTSSGGSKKEYYPEISLDSDTLPEIKGWEVGKDYVVVLKLTQISKNIDKDEDDETEETNSRFEIKEIGVVDTKDIVKDSAAADSSAGADGKVKDIKKLYKK